MNPVAQTLSSITLGPPSNVESITMFPLLGPPEVETPPSYLTLDQAIGDGWTEITEVSEQGSVPELRVFNKGAKPVFILDGEELLGAKQNRVVNLSILVPATTPLTIPVSCVEAGRWRARSRAFSAAPRTQYAAGRAKRMAQVTASMQMSGAHSSDQAEVWADIAAKSERLSACSSTGAMEEMFTVHAGFTDRCVEALLPTEGQCGALFLIDGRVVGFDLFDRASTLRRLLPKLVRSVAVDAVDGSYVGPGFSRADEGAADPAYAGRSLPAVAAQRRRWGFSPRRSERRKSARRQVSSAVLTKVAEHFLARTCASEIHEMPALGLGRDVRLVSREISGAALNVDGSLLHLSAFHI
jgi:hypothetical protein